MIDQTTTLDTRAAPALRIFRCEAYFDKGKCLHKRLVQQTRGSYLSRGTCHTQQMSYSLGGDPSEMLLPIILGKGGPEDKQISQGGNPSETL